MASWYRLSTQLETTTEAGAQKEESPSFVLITEDEMNSPLLYEEALVPLKSLLKTEDCFAVMLRNCMIGSFVVLDKENLLEPTAILGFQVDDNKLVLVDNSGTCTQIIAEFLDYGAQKPLSPAHLLLLFMKYFIKDDSLFLTKIENELERLEESLFNQEDDVDNFTMMTTRRRIFKLHAFYEQLSDVADVFSDDELDLFSTSDQDSFRLFSQQTERLQQRSNSLREYNLQIRELYHMEADTKLNNTMRLLTVIATIFIPLTLITSWYGMNFQNMPELSWEYGYLVVIGIAALIIIIELILFKKKKWL